MFVLTLVASLLLPSLALVAVMAWLDRPENNRHVRVTKTRSIW